MRLSLHCHPLSFTSAVNDLWVTYAWLDNGDLWIKYYMEGALDMLNLPERMEPERVDGLWKTTCFELFLREASGPSYCEFNFSPSSCWSAYQFSDYRDGMTNLAMPMPPDIKLDKGDAYVTLEVTLDLSHIWQETDHVAAFSAVIADNCGSKSYWALSHPPGKPDFHHKDGFTHQLKA